MKYEVIMENGKYALIFRCSRTLTEYAVVCGLNKECGDWDYTCVYYDIQVFGKSKALLNALDYYVYRTTENYISRFRLEELATLFKDGMIQDDSESAMEFFNEICEMSENEKEFFGIEDSSPILNTKFTNPMYNKGYDGFADGSNNAD